MLNYSLQHVEMVWDHAKLQLTIVGVEWDRATANNVGAVWDLAKLQLNRM